ncbi:MAG: hypothetical protein RMK81_06420 [Geminicoccaceae bacterium]|nr:hypothetical protein [Geminicoccaceae bacterium]MDW8369890.1 hypothetical protein [Geminicoccaceae bacterium]
MIEPSAPHLDPAGFAGWRWCDLGPEELDLAWPLARLCGAAADLAAWRATAEAWLERDRRGGLGALANASGVIVALARFALAGSPAAVLEVPWLGAVEVTPRPRCLEALLHALGARARACGCAAVRIARSGPSAPALAELAARLGFEAEPTRWRWPIDEPRAGIDAPLGREPGPWRGIADREGSAR